MYAVLCFEHRNNANNIAPAFPINRFHGKTDFIGKQISWENIF